VPQGHASFAVHADTDKFVTSSVVLDLKFACCSG